MPPTSGLATSRTRPDRCPGVLRPWLAEDGGLVRVRVPGGQLPVAALQALVAVAEEYGDGRVRVTGRANLQLRGMPVVDGLLAAPALASLAATGLLPSPAHDRARNVLASPQTGLTGGRADLRPVVASLDRALVGSAALARLPGRFLFTLDDGRGDLAGRHRDLGLVAVSGETGQLRIGPAWGEVVPLDRAGVVLAEWAAAFLERRGSGPDAAWHVDELAEPLLVGRAAVPGAEVTSGPLPFGQVDGGEHVAVDDGIDAATARAWAERTDNLVVTPWHGVLVPEVAP